MTLVNPPLVSSTGWRVLRDSNSRLSEGCGNPNHKHVLFFPLRAIERERLGPGHRQRRDRLSSIRVDLYRGSKKGRKRPPRSSLLWEEAARRGSSRVASSHVLERDRLPFQRLLAASSMIASQSTSISIVPQELTNRLIIGITSCFAREQGERESDLLNMGLALLATEQP